MPRSKSLDVPFRLGLSSMEYSGRPAIRDVYYGEQRLKGSISYGTWKFEKANMVRVSPNEFMRILRSTPPISLYRNRGTGLTFFKDEGRGKWIATTLKGEKWSGIFG